MARAVGLESRSDLNFISAFTISALLFSVTVNKASRGQAEPACAKFSKLLQGIPSPSLAVICIDRRIQWVVVP